MNKYIFTFLIFIAYTNLLQSQPAVSLSGTIEYTFYVNEVKVAERIEGLTKKDPSFALYAGSMQQMTTIKKGLNPILSVCDNFTLFELAPSVISSDPNYKTNYFTAKTMAMDGIEQQLTDHEANTRITQYLWQGSLISIEDHYQQIKWTSTGNTKKNRNYVLNEMTGTKPDGSIFHVWYAPALPYPYGPRGIDGLPGVVFEVYFGEAQTEGIVLKNINLSARNIPCRLKLPKAQTSLNKQEWADLLQKLENERRF